jgi:hypothetical protein
MVQICLLLVNGMSYGRQIDEHEIGDLAYEMLRWNLVNNPRRILQRRSSTASTPDTSVWSRRYVQQPPRTHARQAFQK